MGLRHEIINYLREVGEATAKEIAMKLNIDVSIVKVYMNRLFKSGFVERRKVGAEYVYRLSTPLLPPPTSSSSSTNNKVNMKVNIPVNMKVNNRESLYNVNSSKVNIKVNNKVNIAKDEVNNKYNVNFDSSLYFLYYIRDELKKLLEQIEFYVNSYVNFNVNSYVNSYVNSDVNSYVNFNVNRDVNPDVNRHVNPKEEEEGGGVRPPSPPGAGVGRRWVYSIVALLNAKRLAQLLLPQNSDSLSIMILERLLTHYIITNNKFIMFSDYRELIEYFNLNISDIIKSKQTLNRALTRLSSYGLIYFVKINNYLKLGLKKKALKMILEYGGTNENKER